MDADSPKPDKINHQGVVTGEPKPPAPLPVEPARVPPATAARRNQPQAASRAVDRSRMTNAEQQAREMLSEAKSGNGRLTWLDSSVIAVLEPLLAEQETLRSGLRDALDGWARTIEDAGPWFSRDKELRAAEAATTARIADLRKLVPACSLCGCTEERNGGPMKETAAGWICAMCQTTCRPR